MLKRRVLSVQIISATGDHELVPLRGLDIKAAGSQAGQVQRLGAILRGKSSPSRMAIELVTRELGIPEMWIQELGWASMSSAEPSPYYSLACERVDYVVRLSIAHLPSPPGAFATSVRNRRGNQQEDGCGNLRTEAPYNGANGASPVDAIYDANSAVANLAWPSLPSNTCDHHRHYTPAASDRSRAAACSVSGSRMTTGLGSHREGGLTTTVPPATALTAPFGSRGEQKSAINIRTRKWEWVLVADHVAERSGSDLDRREGRSQVEGTSQISPTRACAPLTGSTSQTLVGPSSHISLRLRRSPPSPARRATPAGRPWTSAGSTGTTALENVPARRTPLLAPVTSSITQPRREALESHSSLPRSISAPNRASKTPLQSRTSLGWIAHSPSSPALLSPRGESLLLSSWREAAMHSALYGARPGIKMTITVGQGDKEATGMR